MSADDVFVATYEPVTVKIKEPTASERALKEIQDKKAAELDNLDPERTPNKPSKKTKKSGDSDPAESLEEKARSQGWVPQDEWDGDPGDWRPAEVYLERGVYFETMNKQHKQIKKLNKMLEEQARQTKMIIDKAVKDKLKELNKAKEVAIAEGDYAAVKQLDSEINETTTEITKEEQRQTTLSQAERNRILAEFVEENPWYKNNADMKRHADMIAAGYVQLHGAGADPEEVLDFVVGEVQTRFPNEFKSILNNDDGDVEIEEEEEKPRKKFVQKTTSTSRTSSKRSNKKATAADLNDIQRQVGLRWVQVGAMNSLDEYAQSLKEMGELN